MAGPIRFVSEFDRERGANPLPMLIHGHDAHDTAGIAAEVSTISTVAVETLDDLRAIVACDDVLGIWTHDPEDREGEVAEAIELVRAARGRRVSLWGAWTPDVRTGAGKPLACGVDGLILPEVDAGEMFAYIFAIFQWAAEGGKLSVDVDGHLSLLRRSFENSKFWWAAANRLADPA